MGTHVSGTSCSLIAIQTPSEKKVYSEIKNLLPLEKRNCPEKGVCSGKKGVYSERKTLLPRAGLCRPLLFYLFHFDAKPVKMLNKMSYRMYPIYSNIITLYHNCPKFFNKPIL